jgi:hypothetical protein
VSSREKTPSSTSAGPAATVVGSDLDVESGTVMITISRVMADEVTEKRSNTLLYMYLLEMSQRRSIEHWY